MPEIKVSELAKLLNAEFTGDGEFQVSGISSLTDAHENEVSFMVSDKYRHQVDETKARVVLAPVSIKGSLPEGKIYIYCENPNQIFSKIVQVFAPPPPIYQPEIDPTARIADDVNIHPSVHIGPYTVISKGVTIQENSVILSCCFIGENTSIGKNTFIHPNCVIRERVRIGNNVIIHPGVCIGSDGFGYEATPHGIVKIPQLGTVRIDDNVEIGANCAIDRARFGVTWIKTGAKLDNLVHVAHNAQIGEFSMLIAQAGIAGSSKIGKGVIIAGQAGVSHGLDVGDGARVGGQAGVTHDVPAGESWMGTLAEPAKDFVERMMLPRRFKKLLNRVTQAEKTIKDICSKINL